MKISKVEHSPLPGLLSVKDTRLLLNKSQLSCLRRAARIFNEAEDLIEKHINMELAEWDPDMDRLFIGYHIEEFLEQYGHEGLLLD